MCWIIACQCSYQRGLLHPANLVFARENVNIDNICPPFCAWTCTPCDAIKQFDLRQKSEQLDKEERTLDFCPVSSLLEWMRRTHVIFGKSCRGCQGWPHPSQHPSPQQPNQLPFSCPNLIKTLKHNAFRFALHKQLAPISSFVHIMFLTLILAKTFPVWEPLISDQR